MTQKQKTKWSVRGEVTSQKQVWTRTLVLTLAIVVVADLIDLIANLIFAPWQIVRSAIQTTLIAGGLGAYVIYTHSRANLKLYEMKTYLARLSEMDSLTGLLNRRAFIDIMDASREAGQRRVLLLLDIDAFKSINDRFGHPAGDAVIADVGAIMRTVFALDAPVARLGGEEFAAWLPTPTLAQAMPLAERFREAVANRDFRAGPHVLSVRVSIGLALLAPGHTVQEVYSRADRAMYAAKREGGNRIVVATHDA